MTRLSCEEAARQFFAYLDRALSGQSVEDLEEHLAACLDCCDKLQFSRRMDRFIRERLGEAPLPEGLEEQIRRGLAMAEGPRE
jgi:anti-sigma factor (TIGR02949 family)